MAAIEPLGRRLGKGALRESKVSDNPWPDGVPEIITVGHAASDSNNRLVIFRNTGDLISEVALAIEMGSDATDLGLTIHPHPTLSETVMFAAEAFDGTLTDLYVPKKK